MTEVAVTHGFRIKSGMTAVVTHGCRVEAGMAEVWIWIDPRVNEYKKQLLSKLQQT